MRTALSEKNIFGTGSKLIDCCHFELVEKSQKDGCVLDLSALVLATLVAFALRARLSEMTSDALVLYG